VTEVLFDICKVEEDHVAGLVAVVAFTLCNVDASFYKHAAHTVGVCAFTILKGSLWQQVVIGSERSLLQLKAKQRRY
jgi:hypothetical protein